MNYLINIAWNYFLLVDGRWMALNGNVAIPSITDPTSQITVFEMTKEILDEWKALPNTIEDVYKVGGQRYQQGLQDFQEIKWNILVYELAFFW